MQKPPQTQDDVTKLLSQVGWSGAELARRVAVANSTVYNWLHGKTETPGAVLAYLRLILRIRALAQQIGELNG